MPPLQIWRPFLSLSLLDTLLSYPKLSLLWQHLITTNSDAKCNHSSSEKQMKFEFLINVIEHNKSKRLKQSSREVIDYTTAQKSLRFFQILPSREGAICIVAAESHTIWSRFQRLRHTPQKRELRVSRTWGRKGRWRQEGLTLRFDVTSLLYFDFINNYPLVYILIKPVTKSTWNLGDIPGDHVWLLRNVLTQHTQEHSCKCT